MKRLLTYNLLLFAVFLIGCFLFFEINYRYGYRFMEQYSLFLCTFDYFTGLLAQPGGFNEYVTAFLTQFFGLPFAASGCLALLLGAIVLLFHGFMKRSVGKELPIVVAMLPAFLFLFFPAESIASLLAALFGVGVAFGYVCIKRPAVRYAYGAIALLLVYLLAAPAHLLAAILMAMGECFMGKDKRRFLVAFVWLVWGGVLALIAMRTLYVVPLREAFLSKYLYHPEHPVPYSFWLIWAAFPVIALVSRIKPPSPLKGELKKKAAMQKILSLLIPLGGLGGLFLFVENPLEQAYRYDWHARNGDWEEIVRHAEKYGVKDKDALVYVNLAYSYVGRFNEALIRYPQIGDEGFIPHDPKTRLGLIEASEVSWRVGHTNSAQRFAFVGVLSSERCVQPRLMKRLVETYLVNGEYKVAEKYIKILEATLFYSDWAKAQRPLLDPAKAESTDWIAQRRHLNPLTENNFDLTKTLPAALAYLIDDHLDNQAALEYGMGYLLLYKELGGFMIYMDRLKEAGMPIDPFYQQAICLYYSAVENNPEKFRSYPIDATVMSRFQEYLGQLQRMTQALLASRYGDTYYYYAQFVQPPKQPNQ